MLTSYSGSLLLLLILVQHGQAVSSHSDPPPPTVATPSCLCSCPQPTLLSPFPLLARASPKVWCVLGDKVQELLVLLPNSCPHSTLSDTFSASFTHTYLSPFPFSRYFSLVPSQSNCSHLHVSTSQGFLLHPDSSPSVFVYYFPCPDMSQLIFFGGWRGGGWG